MGQEFLEGNQIVSAIVPVDLKTGANNGDWISLKGHNRVLVVLFKGAGTAGDDPIFKLQQATAVAGTGAKDLLFSVIRSKVGTQTGVGQFTRTTQTAATSYTDAVSAEAEAIIAVDIKAEDLDVDNDFDCVRLDVADVGSNAQLGCGFYILYEPRSAEEPALSAIAD